VVVATLGAKEHMAGAMPEVDIGGNDNVDIPLNKEEYLGDKDWWSAWKDSFMWGPRVVVEAIKEDPKAAKEYLQGNLSPIVKNSEGKKVLNKQFVLNVVKGLVIGGLAAGAVALAVEAKKNGMLGEGTKGNGENNQDGDSIDDVSVPVVIDADDIDDQVSADEAVEVAGGFCQVFNSTLEGVSSAMSKLSGSIMVDSDLFEPGQSVDQSELQDQMDCYGQGLQVDGVVTWGEGGDGEAEGIVRLHTKDDGHEFFGIVFDEIYSEDSVADSFAQIMVVDAENVEFQNQNGVTRADLNVVDVNGATGEIVATGETIELKVVHSNDGHEFVFENQNGDQVGVDPDNASELLDKVIEEQEIQVTPQADWKVPGVDVKSRLEFFGKSPFVDTPEAVHMSPEVEAAAKAMNIKPIVMNGDTISFEGLDENGLRTCVVNSTLEMNPGAADIDRPDELNPDIYLYAQDGRAGLVDPRSDMAWQAIVTHHNLPEGVSCFAGVVQEEGTPDGKFERYTVVLVPFVQGVKGVAGGVELLDAEQIVFDANLRVTKTTDGWIVSGVDREGNQVNERIELNTSFDVGEAEEEVAEVEEESQAEVVSGEVASIATVKSQYESRNDTADTFEQQKTEIFTEMESFSFVNRVENSKYGIMDAFTLVTNGVVVGSVEMHFNDIDQPGIALLVLNEEAPNGEFLVRVAEQDGDGNLHPVGWFRDKLHEKGSDDYYSPLSQAGPERLAKFLQSLVNEEIEIQIPFGNSSGNDFNACDIISSPCTIAKETDLDVKTFESIIEADRGYFKWLTTQIEQGKFRLDGSETLTDYILALQQAEENGEIADATLVANSVHAGN